MMGRSFAVAAALLLGLMSAPHAAADEAEMVGVEATSARGGSVRCQRMDQGVRCTITSPEGIGRVTLKRQGDTWPAPLVLRLKLRGFESLTLTAGKQRLEISLTSTELHRLLVQHAQGKPGGDGENPRDVETDSPLWPKVQVLDADGRDVGLRLPPEGGCIEVTVPTKLLLDAPALQVAWVDFYRG